MTIKIEVLDQSRGLGIAGFIERYTPASLTAEQWDAWRAPVIELVQQSGASSRNAATVAAGAVCQAIAVSGAEPGTPLVEVLRDEVISRVVHEQRLGMRRGRYVGQVLTQLQLLQAVALGVPRKASKQHTPKVIGSTPWLEALRVLAINDDEFIGKTSQQLLLALENLQPHPWLNPLPESTWRHFRKSPQVTAVLKGLRWDKLRSERVWQEMHQPTPVKLLIESLRYTDASWSRLAVTTRLDVSVTPEVLRGCIVGRSHQLTVKDVPVQQTPITIAGRKSINQRKVSKAERRRMTAQYLETMTNEPEPLQEELEALLEVWVPKNFPESDWLVSRDLTHDIMRRSHIRGTDSFRKHLRLLTCFIAWAVKSGYPGDIERVMTGSAINAYALEVLTQGSTNTATTTRSKLRLLAKTVNPEKNIEKLTQQFQYTNVRPPYTEENLFWITERIPLVTSPATRRAIQTVFALGVGAGLSTGDLQKLTRSNIEDLGEKGIIIHIDGRKPRDIWLRHDYEQMLRDGLSHVSPNGRVLGRRHHKDTVRDLYRNIQPTGDGPEVVQSRLRNTWLAQLMCEPIPLVIVLKVAGLESARTLNDLAPYIHENIGPKSVRGVA